MTDRSPLPPFTRRTVEHKVQGAEGRCLRSGEHKPNDRCVMCAGLDLLALHDAPVDSVTVAQHGSGSWQILRVLIKHGPGAGPPQT